MISLTGRGCGGNLGASIGRLFFREPNKVLMVGWLVGVLVSMGGIFLSFKLDIPTAPVIVAGLALIFFVLLLVRVVRQRMSPSP